jgi:hypothetical protein
MSWRSCWRRRRRVRNPSELEGGNPLSPGRPVTQLGPSSGSAGSIFSSRPCSVSRHGAQGGVKDGRCAALDADSAFPGRASTSRAPCYRCARPGRSSVRYWTPPALNRLGSPQVCGWMCAEPWQRAPRKRASPAWAETASAGSVARPSLGRAIARDPSPQGEGAAQKRTHHHTSPRRVRVDVGTMRRLRDRQCNSVRRRGSPLPRLAR